MKIEKVNDTQIRCTLTKEDLAERQIKLSELAYGTEKAKSLFRDMMQQASYEFGFEAENIPLMIEAIPLSSESIILIITKVEYPEELDSRFSQFTPSNDSGDGDSDKDDSYEAPVLEGAGDIIKFLNSLKNSKEQNMNSIEKKETEIPVKKSDENSRIENVSAKLFVFHSLEEVEKASQLLDGIYDGENSLFHNLKDHKYYLFMHRSQHTAEEFNKVCNILSEYAKQERYTLAVEAFYEEHFNVIISPKALQVLNLI